MSLSLRTASEGNGSRKDLNNHARKMLRLTWIFSVNRYFTSTMSSSHTPNAYVQYLNMIHEMIMDMTCALTVMANDHALDRHQMMALRDELRAQVCSDYRLFFSTPCSYYYYIAVRLHDRRISTRQRRGDACP